MTGGLSEKEPRRRPVVGAVVAAGIGAILVVVALGLPREHAPLPAIARQVLLGALPDWHTTEPVNAIVYGYRGFDTFGETFILLAAVIGIGLLTRRKESRTGFLGETLAHDSGQRRVRVGEHGVTLSEQEALQAEAHEVGEGRAVWPVLPDAEPVGASGPERAEAMTVVVRAGIRIVAPILAVAGLYLVAWGYSPGGGFPGGAVALGVILLMYLSIGYRRMRTAIRPDLVEPIELAGALAIVVLGVAGLVFTGSVSANFLPLGPPQTIRSGGILQVFSISELIEVGTGLTLAAFGLLTMGHDWSSVDPE
ncbi:MAG TPA: MnhB domain-containing protein [Micromonosporaceae bacterium]|jgi:multicomponent Na+:H+ antiporter subunit B